MRVYDTNMRPFSPWKTVLSMVIDATALYVICAGTALMLGIFSYFLFLGDSPTDAAMRQSDIFIAIGVALTIAAYIIVIPLCTGGSTFAQLTQRLRVRNQDGGKAAWWQLVVRNTVFYLPLYLPSVLLQDITLDSRYTAVFGISAAAVWGGDFIFSRMAPSKRSLHSALSRTVTQSS